jgi:peroxiredoxin (alkyl hydroperoxide reductase subunit C)
MSLVTKKAPDFATTAVMTDGSFRELSLADYHGQYVILFFWPLNFTFVCPTEIIAFSDAAKEFAKRGVQLLGCSTDSHFAHLAWRNMPRSEGGIGEVDFPLLADTRRAISEAYGVLLPDGIALRGLFLIDKNGVVRHELVNDLPLGRSVDEALRLVDALQFFEQNGEVCPANWNKGQSGMKPNAEGLKDYASSKYQ